MKELELLVRVGRDDGISVVFLIVICIVESAFQSSCRYSALCFSQGHERTGWSLALVLHAVPQPSKAHQTSVLALHEVRHLVLASLQPLVEPLRHDDTPLPTFHGTPHPTSLRKGVIAAVDRFHDSAVVRVPLRPEGNEAPLHRLELVVRLALVTPAIGLNCG